MLCATVRGGLLVVFLSSGCGYPEFGFAADAATPPPDTAVATDTAPSPSDTEPVDTTASPDTAVTDAPPPRVGCAAASPSHFFCADWEGTTEPTFGWAGYYTAPMPGAGLTVDGTAFMSKGALRSSIPGGGAENAATVYRTFDAPTATNISRVDAYIRFDQVTYSNNVLLFKVQRDNHGASVWLGGDKLFAEAFGMTYRTYNITKSIVPGVWYHFRLESSLQTSGATVRVFIDDMTNALVNVSDASTCLTEGTTRNLAVGLWASMGMNPLTPFAARFDDVSLDWL